MIKFVLKIDDALLIIKTSFEVTVFISFDDREVIKKDRHVAFNLEITPKDCKKNKIY